MFPGGFWGQAWFPVNLALVNASKDLGRGMLVVIVGTVNSASSPE
jgi:hypothetical protein